MTQDVIVFSDTVRNNLLLGRSGIDDARIREALETASLWDEVASFEKGLDTLVGERGITLSGGQKQRLAIARALLLKPSILILDDSFSNIDTNTEEMILRDLKLWTENLTTIIISHRISTIKDSDMIIVMDEGRIIEKGTHKELLKACGIYRKLYLRQQLSEELKEEL